MKNVCFFWKFDKNISLHLYDHAFQHPARPSIRRLALKLTPLPVAITVSYERLDERISENDPTLEKHLIDTQIPAHPSHHSTKGSY